MARAVNGRERRADRRRPGRTRYSARDLAEQLRYLRLGPADRARLEEIRALVTAAADDIVAEFYQHVGGFETLRRFLAGHDRERLRVTLRGYLESLGADVTRVAYAEDRLAIGATHERVGLSPRWYLGAYPLLFEAIARRLAAAHPGGCDELLITLQKVFALDAVLALEAYHRASVGQLEDLVEELDRAQQQLRESSRIDGLTGVFHRDHLVEILQMEIGRGLRFGHGFALLIADVDRFKRINDRHGHPFGDFVLRALAGRLKRALRPWDVVGRLGGDEFLIGLIDCSPHEAGRIAERVRLEVSRAAFEREGRVAAVTLSLGLASLSPATAGFEALLQAADDALYHAKRSGRDRVCAAADPPGADGVGGAATSPEG